MNDEDDTFLMPDKIDKRADRETYNIVARENMEQGETYAEVRSIDTTEGFDPVIHVDYSTDRCSECGSIGRYDEHGFVVCDNEECGMMINTNPMMVAANDADMLQESGGHFSDIHGASVGAL